MAFMHTLAYATEGAPLLIADLPSAPLWRGTADDGRGCVVEYAGHRSAELPKDIAAKPGRVSRKFKSLEEARTFEKYVIAEFLKLHPTAARPPQYPDYPGFSVADRRVFSVEVKFTSAYDSLIKSLKSAAALVSLAPKSKARAIAVEQEAGRGLCAFDESTNLIVLAKLHYAGDPKTLEEPLAKLKMPKSKESIALDGRVLIFSSASAGKDVAGEVADEPFAPIRVEGQQAPCVARIRCAKGNYAFVAKSEVDVGGTGASVLWLKKLET